LVIDVNGDALQFDLDSLTATEGSDVVVTFNNSSSVNSHNWALVEAGTKDAVATDGLAAGQDNHWLPVNDSRVVGSTIVLGPGESADATFTAPAAGTYQFVCTFPGHNFTMFGEFTVN
jgi:azurin|tara:strand:- start:189 stop:542 length:354 start_codon:yes stop_codon:yes gene_type:complete